MGGRGGGDRIVGSTHAVVFDASPLIGLDRLGLLETLRPLLSGAVVPGAVMDEVSPRLTLPTWIIVMSPREMASGLDDIVLGRGERAALSLAVELDPALLIVDESRARRVASRLGVPTIGTAGLLAVAKQERLIAAVRPYLETLVTTGFRLGAEVIESTLRRAGE